ncbi:serine/threonine-protein kinase gin4-related [Anaeramoeba flamelloides]|uniref:Serine/threonine-protein kinase gin4-related n=1 Tax=Anaeramoeba flamelloides TaxID=1746091 RepID=A0ABQ8X5M8_9EUKA|nr:serine/threonine-protein kinase gin4-related [Anaeramoeba flamelloides]
MSSKTVGPYLIGKTIGVGANGKVKIGIHQETKKKVAIKILAKKQFLRQPKTRTKLEREISILKLLRHPNVIRLYDVYETSKKLYLIMELAEGGELFDLLVSKKSLGHTRALYYFQQIIFALNYMHERKICHRDLKPENLLLDKDLNLKIADFGMAQLMKDGSLLETSCGSPQYTCPEIIKGLNYDGRKADVWACGVILYTFISGKLPFNCANINKLLTKIKMGNYVMSENFNELEKELIQKMLTNNPIKRISIKEILKHPLFISNYPENFIPPDSKLKILKIGKIDSKNVQEEILKDLESLGWGPAKKIRHALKKKQLNQVKIYYYLFFKKRGLENTIQIEKIDNSKQKIKKKQTKTISSLPSYPISLNKHIQKSKKSNKKRRKRKKIKIEKNRHASISPLSYNHRGSYSNSRSRSRSISKSEISTLSTDQVTSYRQSDDMNSVLFSNNDEQPFLTFSEDYSEETSEKTCEKTSKTSLKIKKSGGKLIKKKKKRHYSFTFKRHSLPSQNQYEPKNNKLKIKLAQSPQLSLSPKQSWFGSIFNRNKVKDEVCMNMNQNFEYEIPQMLSGSENTNNTVSVDGNENENDKSLKQNTNYDIVNEKKNIEKEKLFEKTCHKNYLQVITIFQQTINLMNYHWRFPSLNLMKVKRNDLKIFITFVSNFVENSTFITLQLKHGQPRIYNTICKQLLHNTKLVFE